MSSDVSAATSPRSRGAAIVVAAHAAAAAALARLTVEVDAARESLALRRAELAALDGGPEPAVAARLVARGACDGALRVLIDVTRRRNAAAAEEKRVALDLRATLQAGLDGNAAVAVPEPSSAPPSRAADEEGEISLTAELSALRKLLKERKRSRAAVSAVSAPSFAMDGPPALAAPTADDHTYREQAVSLLEGMMLRGAGAAAAGGAGAPQGPPPPSDDGDDDMEIDAGDLPVVESVSAAATVVASHAPAVSAPPLPLPSFTADGGTPLALRAPLHTTLAPAAHPPRATLPRVAAPAPLLAWPSDSPTASPDGGRASPEALGAVGAGDVWRGGGARRSESVVVGAVSTFAVGAGGGLQLPPAAEALRRSLLERQRAHRVVAASPPLPQAGAAGDVTAGNAGPAAEAIVCGRPSATAVVSVAPSAVDRIDRHVGDAAAPVSTAAVSAPTAAADAVSGRTGVKSAATAADVGTSSLASAAGAPLPRAAPAAARPRVAALATGTSVAAARAPAGSTTAGGARVPSPFPAASAAPVPVVAGAANGPPRAAPKAAAGAVHPSVIVRLLRPLNDEEQDRGVDAGRWAAQAAAARRARPAPPLAALLATDAAMGGRHTMTSRPPAAPAATLPRTSDGGVLRAMPGGAAALPAPSTKPTASLIIPAGTKRKPASPELTPLTPLSLSLSLDGVAAPSTKPAAPPTLIPAGRGDDGGGGKWPRQGDDGVESKPTTTRAVAPSLLTARASLPSAPVAPVTNAPVDFTATRHPAPTLQPNAEPRPPPMAAAIAVATAPTSVGDVAAGPAAPAPVPPPLHRPSLLGPHPAVTAPTATAQDAARRVGDGAAAAAPPSGWVSVPLPRAPPPGLSRAAGSAGAPPPGLSSGRAAGSAGAAPPPPAALALSRPYVDAVGRVAIVTQPAAAGAKRRADDAVGTDPGAGGKKPRRSASPADARVDSGDARRGVGGEVGGGDATADLIARAWAAGDDAKRRQLADDVAAVRAATVDATVATRLAARDAARAALAASAADSAALSRALAASVTAIQRSTGALRRSELKAEGLRALAARVAAPGVPPADPTT